MVCSSSILLTSHFILPFRDCFLSVPHRCSRAPGILHPLVWTHVSVGISARISIVTTTAEMA